MDNFMEFLKFFKKIGFFLKNSEKTNSNFWLVVSFTGIIFNFAAFHHWDSRQLIFQSPIEKSVAVQTSLKISGGEGESRFALGKRKKFDLAFHRRLEQHFPDWEERMNYQKQQEIFYKSAIKKKSEVKRLRMKETSKMYTKQELDAISYFHGTGFYKKYQDPTMKPNIFDTRQTFLFKMHDRTRLLEFLNSFNNRNH